jgi:hypothetical protein
MEYILDGTAGVIHDLDEFTIVVGICHFLVNAKQAITNDVILKQNKIQQNKLPKLIFAILI